MLLLFISLQYDDTLKKIEIAITNMKYSLKVFFGVCPINVEFI